MANTYYQFGPSAAGMQGRLNRFNPTTGIQFSPVAREYYEANPDAQFQLALQGYNTSGPSMVAPQFREFVSRWIPEQYKRYQGQAGINQPETNQDFFLQDYLSSRDPTGDYLRSGQQTQNMSRYSRPTRLLRR